MGSLGQEQRSSLEEKDVNGSITIWMEFTALISRRKKLRINVIPEKRKLVTGVIKIRVLWCLIC